MNPFIAKDDGKYVLFSITFAVVPYVGTWIEIDPSEAYTKLKSGRSLRGNVDRNHPAHGRAAAGIGSFPTWERG